jgi:hypothetical protein
MCGLLPAAEAGQEGQAMRDTYCWIHEVHEAPGYLRCGECGHWYATPDVLVDDFNLKLADVGFTEAVMETDPASIPFCAYCSHNF